MLEVEELCGVKADKRGKERKWGRSQCWKEKRNEPPEKSKQSEKPEQLLRALASFLGSECR